MTLVNTSAKLTKLSTTVLRVSDFSEEYHRSFLSRYLVCIVATVDAKSSGPASFNTDSFSFRLSFAKKMSRTWVQLDPPTLRLLLSEVIQALKGVGVLTLEVETILYTWIDGLQGVSRSRDERELDARMGRP